MRDVTLENLGDAPREVRRSVYWELENDAAVDPEFQKEEWFSSTLLEWGPCGKLVEDDLGAYIGFAQYAPPSLFPRVATFAAGQVSPDAVYLAYCYVVPGHRGSALGSQLVRAVARDLVDRGYRALEALGANDWSGGWVLPAPFLARNRFHVVRDDPLVPLWRLDLRHAPGERAEVASAAAEA